MRRSVRMALMMVVAGAAPLAGQDAYAFRYAPATGAAVRTLTEMRTITTFTGFPALPDGSTLEEERRVYGHHVVQAEDEGGWLVAAEIDSIRGRRRLEAEPWRDLRDSTLVGRTAVARLTSQFAVAGFRTAAPTDGEVFRPVGAMIAGLDFAFPGEPVTVGQAFPTGGRIHLRVTASPETGVAVDETVFGDLVLTLDSVVRTGVDTLAYLRFGGALTPRTTSPGGEGGAATAGSFTGSFAGRLIWSSGWDAFVAGVARVRVEGRVTARTARGRVAANAVWDATLRHQVRP